MRHILQVIWGVVESIFYDDSLNVMSEDVRRLNRDDFAVYNEGLKQLRNGADEVDLIFSDGTKMTLVK